MIYIEQNLTFPRVSYMPVFCEILLYKIVSHFQLCVRCICKVKEVEFFAGFLLGWFFTVAFNDR